MTILFIFLSSASTQILFTSVLCESFILSIITVLSITFGGSSGISTCCKDYQRNMVKKFVNNEVWMPVKFAEMEQRTELTRVVQLLLEERKLHEEEKVRKEREWDEQRKQRILRL